MMRYLTPIVLLLAASVCHAQSSKPVRDTVYFDGISWTICASGKCSTWQPDSSLTKAAEASVEYLSWLTDDKNSYLAMSRDSVFRIHGNVQTVLKNLTKREADAWARYSEMVEIHEALRRVILTLTDDKRREQSMRDYRALLRKYQHAR